MSVINLHKNTLADCISVMSNAAVTIFGSQALLIDILKQSSNFLSTFRNSLRNSFENSKKIRLVRNIVHFRRFLKLFVEIRGNSFSLLLHSTVCCCRHIRYVESGLFRNLIEFFQPLMFVCVTIRDLEYYVQHDEFPC